MHPTVDHWPPDDARYPVALRGHRARWPDLTISALGSAACLTPPTVGLLCSVKSPGNLILQAYDLAISLRDAGVTVLGGFHSPMEKECLRLLLRGRQPVVVCPARSLEGMRVPSEWREPLQQGRLLLLSPFAPHQRRVTAELAHARNELVVALADHVLIVHAAPGGQTEALARQVLEWNKPLYALDDEHNQPLFDLGAVRVSPRSWPAAWRPTPSGATPEYGQGQLFALLG